MGRSPCCEPDLDVKKGPWTTEEDNMLVDYIEKNGACNWRQLPNRAGLNRCGKSCRLRWINYLRPDIKRGMFSEEEESLIIHFHSVLGNKWSQMAAQLPGRTDNEIKNYWNTHLRKKLLRNGIDPVTHRRRTDLNPLANLLDLVAAAANSNNFAPVPLAGAIQLQKLQLVHTLIQLMTSSLSPPNMDALHLLGFPFAFQNLNQPSSDFHDFHNTSQALLGSLNYVESGVGATTSTSNTTDTNSSFMCVPPMNVMPSLVHNSPENFSVNQASDVVNVAANVSSESSPFESWSRLSLDDLNIEFGWKDILEHISWLNPLEQQMETLKK